jgi:hypothetical protein
MAKKKKRYYSEAKNIFDSNGAQWSLDDKIKVLDSGMYEDNMMDSGASRDMLIDQPMKDRSALKKNDPDSMY